MLESLKAFHGASPVVICGLARAGTRYIANVLNTYNDVAVVGEVPTKAMRLSLESKIEIMDYYRRMGREDNWGKQFIDSMSTQIFTDWFLLSKHNSAKLVSKVNSESSLSHFCLKTPYHEQLHSAYSELLGGHGVKYIFCFRDFESHFVSMKAMNPRNNLKWVYEKFMSTARIYLSLKASSPDCVSLITVEDLKSGDYDILNERIFDFLQKPRLAESSFRDARKNSSENLGFVKPDITSEERVSLSELPFLQLSYELILKVGSEKISAEEALDQLQPVFDEPRNDA